MAVTSATLLERLRDPRDMETWGRLNDLYAPLIRTWADRFGVRGADADDIVQRYSQSSSADFPSSFTPNDLAHSEDGSGPSPRILPAISGAPDNSSPTPLAAPTSAAMSQSSRIPTTSSHANGIANTTPTSPGGCSSASSRTLNSRLGTCSSYS